MSIENIKEYTESFGMFGEPVEYKGLNIYPILVKDAYQFNNKSSILDINKNELGDIELIQMSYLLFLINIIRLDDSAKDAFLWIVEKCLGLHYDEALYIDKFPANALLVQQGESDNKVILTVNGWEFAFEVEGKRASLFIGDKKIKASEFDELRHIILYQNIEGYDDAPLSDDVKRVMAQYYKVKNKGIKQPTLEDKMLAILVSSSETRESIQNMPYRQFDRLFGKVNDKTEYMVTVPLMPNLNNPEIEHWIFKKDRDKFGDIFSDATEVGKATIK